MDSMRASEVSAVRPLPDAAREMRVALHRERVSHRTLSRTAKPAGQDPDGYAMHRRRSNLAQRVAALRELGRMPRVCLYALTVNAEVPRRSLDEVRAFAVREGWQAGAEQTFVDHSGPTNPATRSGWIRVQQQVRSGFADGVVALTQSAITPHREEYEAQLQWFVEHFGFIALVHPEVPAVQR